MKYFLFFFFSLMACHTEKKKPDYKFMHSIKEQAFLDSTLKTSIEIYPRKVFFRAKKSDEKVEGYFFIKNTGKIDFNIISIKSNCDCVTSVYSSRKKIKPQESLKVDYKINLPKQQEVTKQSIIAIGNCQFGNQTFYTEGVIY